MTVDEFVAVEARLPFEWGATDCASTADRWACWTCGFSPMQRFQRRHEDEAQARAWLAETPLPVAVNRVMRHAGFVRTTAPQPGDIGIVRHGNQICVAILTSRFWFSRNEHGLIGVPDFWKAWRVPQQRCRLPRYRRD